MYQDCFRKKYIASHGANLRCILHCITLQNTATSARVATVIAQIIREVDMAPGQSMRLMLTQPAAERWTGKRHNAQPSQDCDETGKT